MFTSKLQKGFTIIELIVVVAIIALLTAITIANLTASKAKSRDAKRISDINQLQLAMELFFDRCNRYPVEEVVAGATVPKLTDSGDGCPAGITLQSFIAKIPTPPTGGDYYYAANAVSTPTDYVLQSSLEKYNQALLDNSPALYTATCSTTEPYYYCVAPR